MAGKRMDDAVVLHIGAIPDHDPAEIAPQACSGSDIAPMGIVKLSAIFATIAWAPDIKQPSARA